MNETGMTISQALRFGKKLKGRIDEAHLRATASVNYFQDTAVAFDFDAQVARAHAASDDLAELQGRIAVANATNRVTHEGKELTLSHAVRVLQEYKARLTWLRALAVKAGDKTVELHNVYTNEGHRTVGREVVCKLPEAKRAEVVDALQDRFDKLNSIVEEANQRVRI